MDALISRPHLVPNPNLQEQLVPNLLQLLLTKDKSTQEHSSRVHRITQEWITYLRRQWLLLDANIEAIEVAAVLHDIGKVGVLDEILQKAETLTELERVHLEQHPEIGYQMIRDFPGMAEVAEIIRHHHERWNGGGYPLGLRGNQIPVAARIIAIVDAFDAMTSNRPYQAARPAQAALDEISKEAGQQFCPTFAAQFVQFMHARNT